MINKKKCIAKKCEDCVLCEDMEMEEIKDGKPTGIKKIQQVCVIKTMNNALHFVMQRMDGMQAAVEQSRNRSADCEQMVRNYAQASLNTLSNMGIQLKEAIDERKYIRSEVDRVEPTRCNKNDSGGSAGSI